VDRLRELGLDVQAENFGARTQDEQFANRRTELWWILRDGLREDAALEDAPDPARRTLPGDLVAPHVTYRSSGRLLLEPKAGIKKRIGRSPDHGDVLVLAVTARVRVGCGVYLGDEEDEADPAVSSFSNPRLWRSVRW
jgi:hypothetical protein